MHAGGITDNRVGPRLRLYQCSWVTVLAPKQRKQIYSKVDGWIILKIFQKHFNGI